MYPISQFLIYGAFFFLWHLNHCVSLDSVLSLGGISVVTIFICIHIFCSLTVKKEKGYIFYALVNINSFFTCWFLKFPWRNSNLILVLWSLFFFFVSNKAYLRFPFIQLMNHWLLCRNHRGLRHYWGLRVRGQHTKTTGRRGKTVGVSKKRWVWKTP